MVEENAFAASNRLKAGIMRPYLGDTGLQARVRFVHKMILDFAQVAVGLPDLLFRRDPCRRRGVQQYARPMDDSHVGNLGGCTGTCLARLAGVVESQHYFFQGAKID